jgi:hypothetical protein
VPQRNNDREGNAPTYSAHWAAAESSAAGHGAGSQPPASSQYITTQAHLPITQPTNMVDARTAGTAMRIRAKGLWCKLLLARTTSVAAKSNTPVCRLFHPVSVQLSDGGVIQVTHKFKRHASRFPLQPNPIAPSSKAHALLVHSRRHVILPRLAIVDYTPSARCSPSNSFAPTSQEYRCPRSVVGEELHAVTIVNQSCIRVG